MTTDVKLSYNIKQKSAKKAFNCFAEMAEVVKAHV